MARIVRLDPLAELDFQDGVDWYENQQRGLGARFWSAVTGAIDHIIEDPILVSTPVPDVPEDIPARRTFVPGFPYQIVFVEWRGEVRVIAVAHLARKPAYWNERLPR